MLTRMAGGTSKKTVFLFRGYSGYQRGSHGLDGGHFYSNRDSFGIQIADTHQVLGHMEHKKVQQVVIGGGGFYRKHAGVGAFAGQHSDRSQSGNVAEQFFDRIRLLRFVQWADMDHQRTGARGPGLGRGHRRGCHHGGGNHHRSWRRCRNRCCRRHGTRGQHADTLDQGRSIDRLAFAARLVAGQQAA